jgi:hypothetical protein
VRSREEIEREKHALKALRGDFAQLSASGDSGGALQAVRKHSQACWRRYEAISRTCAWEGGTSVAIKSSPTPESRVQRSHRFLFVGWRAAG